MKHLIIYINEYTYVYLIVDTKTEKSIMVLKSNTKLETLLDILGDSVLRVEEHK